MSTTRTGKGTASTRNGCSAERAGNGNSPTRNGSPDRTGRSPASTRCAIYCRKSVADRNGTDFGSIDAQREAVEAYACSQGWTVLPHHYNDEGYSGGTIRRPAFERLLDDARAGRVDIVAVHRIDRLSRSLADFTALMKLFDEQAIAFVATAQSFDTSTSMGRFTLNIMASFGQLEREMISERTADKMLATRRKGRWTGGPRPLGFDLVDKRLVINKAEAKVVRDAFNLFVETRSIIRVLELLNDRGYRTKRGKVFDRGTLSRMLASPLYAGRMRAGDEVVKGEHAAILDVEVWERAQEILDANKKPQKAKRSSESLLAGLLRCGRCGTAMSPTHTKRGNTQYHYYKCGTAEKRGASACPGSRIPAAGIEAIVVDKIKAIGQDPALVEATITAVRQRIDEEAADLDRRLADLFTQQENLIGRGRKALDGLDGSGNARPLHEALGEITAGLDRVESEVREVRDEREALGRVCEEEGELRTTRLSFSTVWDELFPRERGRIVQKLVDEVTYSADTDEVEIRFKPEGFALIAAKESS